MATAAGSGINWNAVMLNAAGQGTAGILQAYMRSKDQQAASKASRESREMSDSQFNRDLAFRESTQNPFRQQAAQVGQLARFDGLEQAGTRRQPTLAGVPYAQPGLVSPLPQLSPQTLMAIAAARQSVMAGRTAPDYTEDNNRGASATLDMFGVGSGRLNPTTDQAFSNGAPLRRPGWLGQPGGAQMRSNNPANPSSIASRQQPGRQRGPVGRTY